MHVTEESHHDSNNNTFTCIDRLFSSVPSWVALQINIALKAHLRDGRGFASNANKLCWSTGTSVPHSHTCRGTSQRLLHDNSCRKHISDSSEREVFFSITSGVLRGCPVSGLIFTWVMAPMLHAIEHEVDNEGLGHTRACADDVGAAIADLQAMKTHAKHIYIMDEASGLALKPKKCQIVPPQRSSKEGHACEFAIRSIVVLHCSDGVRNCSFFGAAAPSQKENPATSLSARC